MYFPDKQTVEVVRSGYPEGTRVVLEQMNDILSRILDKMSYQYF